MVWERRYQWARGDRDSLIVCRRVGLTVRTDPRLGLPSRDTRDHLARFCEGVHPELARELNLLADEDDELEAERIAEGLAPIRFVAEDKHGPLDLTGRLWPPIRRYGSWNEIDFRVRELDVPALA